MTDAERDQVIEDARRALDDPAVQRTFAAFERGLVELISDAPYATNPRWKEMQDEWCCELRVLRRMRRNLFMCIPAEAREDYTEGWK